MAKRIIIFLAIVLFFEFFLFPAPVFASEAEIGQSLAMLDENALNLEVNEPIFNASLPENSDLRVKASGYYPVTAYTSEISQCDGAPCLTANGFNLCEHGIEDSIAANFLRFGTKVKIPDLFGDRVFVVRDRMNERYDNYIDIWMKDKQDARSFGVIIAKIEVLE